MAILIVEDKLKTENYLKQGLVRAGCVVDLARDGKDGLRGALTEPYDLVIVDVMLPGIDCWEILRDIRKPVKKMLVLFLSARDHATRITGPKLGMDNFVVRAVRDMVYALEVARCE